MTKRVILVCWLLGLALPARALCICTVSNWGNTNIAVLSDQNTNYFVLFPCTTAIILTSNTLVGQVLHGYNFTTVSGLNGYYSITVNCLNYGANQSLEVIGGLVSAPSNSISLNVSNLTCTLVQTNGLNVSDTNAFAVLASLRETADGHTVYMCLGLGLVVFICYRLGRK